MAKIKYLTGTPVLRAKKGDVNTLVLQEGFTVIDKRGRRWHVPAGFETDGASIPSFLTPIIGDPFNGVTLPAAIIHDYYCVHKTRSQKDTHRIFRELIYHEMKRNKKYGWIRYPWNMHNGKLWQYQRCKLMWAAVRSYNRVKNPNWK
jgi:hypothetical protein